MAPRCLCLYTLGNTRPAFGAETSQSRSIVNFRTTGREFCNRDRPIWMRHRRRASLRLCLRIPNLSQSKPFWAAERVTLLEENSSRETPLVSCKCYLLALLGQTGFLRQKPTTVEISGERGMESGEWKERGPSRVAPGCSSISIPRTRNQKAESPCCSSINLIAAPSTAAH